MNSFELVIQTVNLGKIYDQNRDQETIAIRNVNLNIKKGEFLSLMGVSGSGKTTLLNLLSGIDRPTSGKIYIDQQDIWSLNEDQLLDFRKHKIGLLFQSYNLIPFMTAFENIELPLIISKTKKEIRTERVKELLKIIELEDRSGHLVDQLSGGQKQRVALARALANKPEILLCDEPTADLDIETANKMMELLITINKKDNQTIILVTHDITIAKKTQKILSLVDGEIKEG